MENDVSKVEAKQDGKKPICGIVMPISSIDGCAETHWEEVKSILVDAIKSADYEANLVSNADDVGVIQKRIVQNLYDNDIVVCDVSCKNANVMFELGLRLAFDKPTIIVVDDKTGFSFDTSPIEHLVYPRDLRYSKIVEFKNKLKEKIIGTMKSAADSNYSPFLKHFGEFRVASIEHSEGSVNDVVLQRLDDMQQTIGRLSFLMRNAEVRQIQDIENDRDRLINNIVRDRIEQYIQEFGISMTDLYNNINNEKIRLRRYLERDEDLCRICGSQKRMQKAIDDYVSLF